MIWFYLILAIACEAGWAIAMKLSDGLTRIGPAAVAFVLYALSLVFLAFATKKMDVGVGYAIWAGSGVTLIALAGVIYFKEPMTMLKAVSIGLVLAGIIGLNLGGVGHGSTAPATPADPPEVDKAEGSHGQRARLNSAPPSGIS